MKNLRKSLSVFFIVMLFTSSFAQRWTYSSGGNEFDGKYKTSGVTGSGGEFPYSSPRLRVNYFLNSKNLNIYVSGGGYSGCDGKVIYIKFDGDETKYIMRGSSDVENEVWFFTEEYYP